MMSPTTTHLLLLLFAGVACAQKITYSGYSVYRAIPQKNYQITGLRSLMHEEAEDGIEFWREPSSANKSVDILVSPEKHDFLVTKLRVMRIPNEMIMEDVGEIIEKTAAEMSRPRHTYRDNSSDSESYDAPGDYLSQTDFYTRYNRYSTIESKLIELAQDPKVTLENIGLSYEKRKLYLVKVSSDPDAKKPVIFVDAGHHAREWITHSTLLYILESLVSDSMPYAPSRQRTARMDNNSTDKLCLDSNTLSGARVADANLELKSYLDKYDFWFLPVVNPDGYEFTHTSNRLWRKTRSGRSPWCTGTDANRNYPVHWGGQGTSRSPCDDIYAGPRPLSEPETEALANILSSNQGRIVMYISLHAYSQVILSPYGHARVYPENYAELERVAQIGMKALAEVRGTRYRFGTSAILMYPAAGGSDDFAYTNANIKLAYTIELPDQGHRGFLLPPSEIIPVGHETAVGLAAMIDAIQ